MGKRLSGKQPASHSLQVADKAQKTAQKRPAQKRPAKKEYIHIYLPDIVVINLERRMDRWIEVLSRLDKLGDAVGNFERVLAVDGKSAAIEIDSVTKTWNTANNWKYVTKVFEGGEQCGYTAKTLELTHGERGCAASHIAQWRRCAKGVGPLLVLEDDANPLPKFVTRVKQALEDLKEEDPDILYLGYSQAAPWRRRVTALVREAEYLWTTVAYVLWPGGARKLLASLPVDQPVDNYMAALISRNALRGFAIVPEIVKQAGEWNVNNDIAHSDDKAWIQNCPD